MGKLKAHIIPVTPFQQNCTLLFDEQSREGVLVDPGGEWPRIANEIEKAGVTVKAIWITHGHIDHVGAAMQAKEALGVQIIGSHHDDKPLMDTLEEKAIDYRLPDVRNCTPDRWLSDGDVVDCAGHAFQVFHTPGHAPGHVIYFNAPAKFALLGDVLFHGSIGRTDFPFCNHDDLMRSIKEKVLPLGDDVGFICGHGPGSRIGDERRTNPFIQGL